MVALIKAAQLLTSLALLILLHEFGHFFFAKLFKVRVEKFYLFFNPWFSLFKFKKGETEYGIGWIPFGGYVKISGMIDESMDREAMKQPPKPYEFRSKPAWQRFLIMFGGVLMNFLLAVLIYIFTLFIYGDSFLPNKNVTNGVETSALAREFGIQNGDKILAIQGQEIDYFDNIPALILYNEASTISVERDGEIIKLEIADTTYRKMKKLNEIFVYPRVPYVIDSVMAGSNAQKAGIEKDDRVIGVNGKSIVWFDEYKSEVKDLKNTALTYSILRKKDTLQLNVQIDSNGFIGVYRKANLLEFYEFEHVNYTFAQAVPAGIKKGVNTLKNYVSQMKLVFSSKTQGYKDVGSVISFAKILPATWVWEQFWSFTALLSVILAFMNILPIPALDGGHIMFLLYEMVTGRKPGEKFMERAQLLGMILLLALMTFALSNDIRSFF